jgi:UDP-N-acetylglucosamine acyltransferase
MTKIDSTAIVSSKAEIGNDVTIGPYAIVQDDVVIGDNCDIGPSAVLYNGTRLANNVKIFQGASVANLPQDVKFSDEVSYFYIGENTQIREFVTLHRATIDGGESRIGKNCMLMAYSHIAHDCKVGDNVILANSVQVGGHAELGDYVIIGGSTPVHQFTRVGEHSMIGGGFRIVVDVPPYVLAGNEPLRYAGLNVIGIKRRGFSPEEISEIKKTYDILYNSGLNFSQAKIRIKEELSGSSRAMKIHDFLENTKRTLLRR